MTLNSRITSMAYFVSSIFGLVSLYQLYGTGNTFAMLAIVMLTGFGLVIFIENQIVLSVIRQNYLLGREMVGVSKKGE